MWEHTATIHPYGGRNRMHPDASDDPLRTMIVDRVERSDGRYLIYYGWSVADSPAPDDPADPAAEEASAMSERV